MLLEQNNTNSLEYKKLSKEEMKKRGILGRLIGCCADFIIPTRNGRKYSESLWEKVFSDDIVKEKFNNKVFYGELGHPEDREEVDIEKVAVCMAELPKKSKDGKLRAVFDILNTPNGRLLKTLCDYGSILGISSRGTGDVEEDINGQEIVNEDTYKCEAFDIVILPAVKAARLNYVTESLDTKISLKEALDNTLKEASEEDRSIMKSTLDSLSLDIDEKPENEEADDTGSELLQQLQEALLENKQLKADILALNEKLSVSYTKEATLDESLNKHKKAVKALAESCRELDIFKSNNSKLKEQLKEQEHKIAVKESKIDSLHASIKAIKDNSASLTESIKAKNMTINSLNEQLKQKSDLLNKVEMKLADTESKLNENIDILKKDSALKQKEYARKLTDANHLVEKYKNISKKAVSEYINLQARRLGVNSSEIKNRLPESYNFDDINSVCESLQDYRLNISRLPFNLSETKKLKITESNNSIIKQNQDDLVDDQLLRIAGLK